MSPDEPAGAEMGSASGEETVLRVILNVIWLVFCGLWMAILYAVAGLLCFLLIITIPFGIAAFRIAGMRSGHSAGRSPGALMPAWDR